MEARRKLEVRSSLGRNAEGISDAPYGLDEFVGVATVHLRSQATYVRLDDIRIGIEMKIPDIFEKHGPGDNASLVTHEIFQQLELPRLQFDFLALTADRALDEIHFNAAGAKDGAALLNGRDRKSTRLNSS